jgi:hypothetical protein
MILLLSLQIALTYQIFSWLVAVTLLIVRRRAFKDRGWPLMFMASLSSICMLYAPLIEMIGDDNFPCWYNLTIHRMHLISTDMLYIISYRLYFWMGVSCMPLLATSLFVSSWRLLLVFRFEANKSGYPISISSLRFLIPLTLYRGVGLGTDGHVRRYHGRKYATSLSVNDGIPINM